ncbi:Crp/Fnr family transcriptional regulator [Methylobacterium pseudosasicola]|uniref:cAMP-binding domain of CRP or a regulatory subunit of cAMP-dependent protein kinases n=1 Tax=Methylobacterium pseudosasicola TaxID=582667 RepID=A0A1I4VPU7_9HYPH|nr:Crp/Fnr family transcriptional regulator [Methylobacterium pseudosasicola]SFN03077.1 cAMP-binding domain of CRP or a regulatory subunit of cAMP-dependent protein kinases [Methylobacterium pseudosasicola]
MFDTLIRKLSQAGGLTEADHKTLRQVSLRSRQVPARRDLTSEEDRPENVHLVLSGFVCRYKILPKGQRHITALMVPGDFCDLHVAILDEMDHSIGTMTSCTVVEISRATIHDLTANHPRIAHALWWATLVDEAVLREWLVCLAGREASKRMAHLFCELLLRLSVVGLVKDDSYTVPFTQIDLADMLGLTPVHVNRVVQHLRSENLIVLRRHHVQIPDKARLMTYCDFIPNYLHRRPRVK